MPDGYLNKCKDCARLDALIRYRSPEKRIAITEYEKRRSKDPGRKQKALQYQQKRRSKNPEKYKARTAIGNAIRDGRIHRKPCEVCKNPKAEAHHVDYGGALNVRWFCFKHHRELAHGQKVSAIVA